MNPSGLENHPLVVVLLPSALAVIMLGLGLSLSLDDFRRVAKAPRAVFVGLLCQTLLLPAGCWLIVRAFELPGVFAVGLMLLAASPGGASANLFSHLARGDVALNITLTAVNSVLSLITLPIVVSLSLTAFLGEDRTVSLGFTKVLQVFAVVLVPVSAGMLVRARREAFAKRLDRPIRTVSVVFLLLVILGAIIKERDTLPGYFQQVGLAALAFNLLSLGVGYFLPQVFKLGRRQAVAIGMEVGVHNGALAITIASSPLLLNTPQMAIPAAIYSVIMFFTAAGFSFLMSRDATLHTSSDSPATSADATPLAPEGG